MNSLMQVVVIPFSTLFVVVVRACNVVFFTLNIPLHIHNDLKKATLRTKTQEKDEMFTYMRRFCAKCLFCCFTWMEQAIMSVCAQQTWEP